MNWRFIPYSEFDGAQNMGIDVLLLERATSGPPVLRLYGFNPACLSIGLNQQLDEATVARARERGFDIVRRPSGGRAVLHFKDLTYSFIAAEKGSSSYGILEHSVSAAYKQICAGLQEAFSLLGLKAELGSAQASYRHLADCFLATTNADLHFQGLKLAGSAQLRRHGCVLQHGSIPLQLEQDLMPALLGEALPVSQQKDRHANLFDMLDRSVSMHELSEAMRDGFAKAFSTSFRKGDLTAGEIEEAAVRKHEFEFGHELSNSSLHSL